MMQPDMMHCVNSPELTVLERHRGRLLRWQHEQGTAPFQQQTQSFYNTAGGCGDAGGSSSSFSLGSENLMGLGEVVNHCKMIDPSPGIEYWGQLGKIEVPSDGFGGGMGTASSSRYEMSSGSISRTASCAPPVAAAAADGQLAVALEKLTAPVGRNSFKKRRLERVPSSKGYVEDTRDKKIRGCSDETESKITKQSNDKNNVKNKDGKNTNNSNRETCGSTSRDNSKASEVQKSDYIHVRARRGQATDSHSLAERVRREKISERMKFLQDLVPGCNKVTGKAGMLDEIINYVQSLQRQVEFLSMKLTTVNPRLNFDIDSLFLKEMNPTSSTSFPTIGISSELTNPTYLPFHSMQQLDSCSGLDMGINDPNIGLQKTTTAPMPISEPFFDSSCFAPAPTWESDFQNLYNMELQQVGATTAYQLHQQYIGSVEATNMKTEI